MAEFALVCMDNGSIQASKTALTRATQALNALSVKECLLGGDRMITPILVPLPRTIAMASSQARRLRPSGNWPINATGAPARLLTNGVFLPFEQTPAELVNLRHNFWGLGSAWTK
jgi:hypothetical protein